MEQVLVVTGMQPATASGYMDRLPFGISRLDALIGGGAPAGSVILLAGEPGAGAREFLHTTAVMNALAVNDSDLFELYYGDLDPDVRLPATVHYLSFTSGQAQFEREIGFELDASLASEAIDLVSFTDLSAAFFQMSPVPRDWYLDRPGGIKDLEVSRNQPSVFESLGNFLTEHAPGNLVCIDSVTDLLRGVGDEFQVQEIATVLKGLQRASTQWGGLILLLLNQTTLTREELGQLIDSADGTFVFEWERGGSEIDRTMAVIKFRGVLSRLEADNIVQFDTEISESGFDISDIRKIR